MLGMLGTLKRVLRVLSLAQTDRRFLPTSCRRSWMLLPERYEVLRLVGTKQLASVLVLRLHRPLHPPKARTPNEAGH